MKFTARIPVLAAAVLVLLASTTGCNRLKARDQLNKGVQSYKSAQYEDAINHFQQAVQLDPNLPMAKLYLGTAYAQQVVPNLDSPDNLKNAETAINVFKEVLEKDPNDINSLKTIASTYFNIKKFDEAKQYQLKVLQVDPNDAEANYTIGVIDWTQAYKNALAALAADGLTDGGDGNPKKSKDTCKKLQDLNTELVNDGLQHLQRAVEIRPTYDDAMSYINLTYRRKADLECGDDNARKADITEAQNWLDKAMSTRKANEEKKENKTVGTVEKSS